MWTLIGGGAKALEYCRKPMKNVIPAGVDHIHGRISQVDPENNAVYLESGEKVNNSGWKSSFEFKIKLQIYRGWKVLSIFPKKELRAAMFHVKYTKYLQQQLNFLCIFIASS